MYDMERVISHLTDCMKASRQDNSWVFVRKDIVEDAIAMLKDVELCDRCGRRRVKSGRSVK